MSNECQTVLAPELPAPWFEYYVLIGIEGANGFGGVDLAGSRSASRVRCVVVHCVR